MGQQIGVKSFSNLELCCTQKRGSQSQAKKWGPLLSIGMAFYLSAFGASQSQASELPVRFTQERVDEPLTTETAPWFDPQLLNPHRSRFAIRRLVDLIHLKAVALGGKSQFGVKAQWIEAQASIAVRPPDSNYYQDLSEIPCAEIDQKDQLFAGASNLYSTYDSTLKAANLSSELWKKLLEDNAPFLNSSLQKIRASSESLAIEVAHQIFDRWKLSLENGFREIVETKVPEVEWKVLTDLAKQKGVCAKKGRFSQIKRLEWYQLLEPVSDKNSLRWAIEARAPARILDGIFTAKVTVAAHHIVGVGGVGGGVGGGAGFKGGLGSLPTLVGKFLVDSESPFSQASPFWLEMQGVPKESVRAGKFAIFEDVRLSGLRLEGLSFELRENLKMQPPEHTGHCCDGVLGQDFLKNYVVHFRKDAPPEVQVFSKLGLGSHLMNRYDWIEIYIDRVAGKRDREESKVKVDCNLGTLEIATAKADTLSGLKADISKKGTLLETDILNCSGKMIRVPKGVRKLGIDYLVRGNFILDLPHGRLWFEKGAFQELKPVMNTGITTQFVFDRFGRRVLKLKSLGVEPYQNQLKEGDLKVGQLISAINGQEVDQMDQWAVDQILKYPASSKEKIMIEWVNAAGLNKSLQLRF